jgi:hypothetical protein
MLLGSSVLVGALLVGIGVWRSTRTTPHVVRCFATAQAAEKSAAGPLVASIVAAPAPTALHRMPVGQIDWGAPVIGPWTTHLTSRAAARRIAAWLPSEYLGRLSVTTTRVPAGREWTLRGDDLLGHGVFLEVTAKPIENEHATNILGFIGTPAVPNC